MKDLAALLNISVKEIMTPHVITMLEDDSIETVFRIFDRSHISGAPILSKAGIYIGIVTKTDLSNSKLIEYMKQTNNQLDKIPISHLMNAAPLIVVKEDATMLDAVEKMTKHRVHRVFVTDKVGSIIGVVTTYDVTRQVSLCNNIEEMAMDCSDKALMLDAVENNQAGLMQMVQKFWVKK